MKKYFLFFLTVMFFSLGETIMVHADTVPDNDRRHWESEEKREDLHGPNSKTTNLSQDGENVSFSGWVSSVAKLTVTIAENKISWVEGGTASTGGYRGNQHLLILDPQGNPLSEFYRQSGSNSGWARKYNIPFSNGSLLYLEGKMLDNVSGLTKYGTGWYILEDNCLKYVQNEEGFSKVLQIISEIFTDCHYNKLNSNLPFNFFEEAKKEVTALKNVRLKQTFLSWLNNAEKKYEEQKVLILDENLKVAINECLKKNNGYEPINKELATIKELNLKSRNINSLEGIQSCANLERINFSNNCVTDITPLQHLQKLTWLEAKNNEISSINGLSKIPKLNHLILSNNAISDISMLKKNISEIEIKNQKIEQKSGIVLGGEFETKVVVKGIDGMIPPLNISNKGKLSEDGQEILWDTLTSDNIKVSYTWNKNELFTGTVEIPVSYKEREKSIYLSILENRVGKAQLEEFKNVDVAHAEFISWLVKNRKALELYLNGGAPSNGLQADMGSYQYRNAWKAVDAKKSLEIWCSLWNKHKNSRKGVNLKLAIAIALEFANQQRCWIYGSAGKIIDPNERYVDYSLAAQNDILMSDFTEYPMHLIRNVINNKATDEDIIWLRNYMKEKHANMLTRSAVTSGYNLLTYHSATYDVPTLEEVIKKGGVCGAMSKFSCNLAQSYGVPAFPVGQPGHCAYVYYAANHTFKLGYDIYGWKKSSNYNNGYFYMLATTKMTQDIEKYNESQYYKHKAFLAVSQKEKLDYLDKSLNIESLNYEAWEDKVPIVIERNDEQEIIETIAEINTVFKDYPIINSKLITNLLPIQQQLDKVKKAVNDLFLGNSLNNNVSQRMIDSLKEQLNKLPDGTTKDMCVKKIGEAQNLYNSLTNEDKLLYEINALFTDSNYVKLKDVVSKERINDLELKVSQLKMSEQKNQYELKLNYAQQLIKTQCFSFKKVQGGVGVGMSLTFHNNTAKLQKSTRYAFQPSFGNQKYIEITVETKEGETVFNEQWTGAQAVSKNYELENIPLKENCMLKIYHAQPENLSSNDPNLKISNDKNIYIYEISKFGTLKQVTENQAYHIVPVFAPTKCLDNNPSYSDLFLWTKDDQAANHYFVFHPVADDLVTISSKDNSRWLTTKGKQGSTITQTANENEASYWKIVHLGQNKMAIHYVEETFEVPDVAGPLHTVPIAPKPVLKDSNLSLNICGGSAIDGTKVILYPSSYDSSANQQFVFQEHK